MKKKLLRLTLAACFLSAPQVKSFDPVTFCVTAAAALAAGRYFYKGTALAANPKNIPIACALGATTAVCFYKNFSDYVEPVASETITEALSAGLKKIGLAALYTSGCMYLGFKVDRAKHNKELSQKIIAFSKTQTSFFDSLYITMPLFKKVIGTDISRLRVEDSLISDEIYHKNIFDLQNNLKNLEPELSKAHKLLEEAISDKAFIVLDPATGAAADRAMHTIAVSFDAKKSAEFSSSPHGITPDNAVERAQLCKKLSEQAAGYRRLGTQIEQHFKDVAIDTSVTLPARAEATEQANSDADLFLKDAFKTTQELKLCSKKLIALSDEIESFVASQQPAKTSLPLLKNCPKTQALMTIATRPAFVAPLCFAACVDGFPEVRTALVCAAIGSAATDTAATLYENSDPENAPIRRIIKSAGILTGTALLAKASRTVLTEILGTETSAKQAASIAVPILLGAYTSTKLFNHFSKPNNLALPKLSETAFEDHNDQGFGQEPFIHPSNQLAFFAHNHQDFGQESFAHQGNQLALTFPQNN